MHEKKFTCMKKIFTCNTKISHACQKVHMHEKKISHVLPKFHMLVKKFTCMSNSQKLHMHVNLSEFHMVPCFHTLFTYLSHDFHTHTPSSVTQCLRHEAATKIISPSQGYPHYSQSARKRPPWEFWRVVATTAGCPREWALVRGQMIKH